jgi:hypothetical protein
MVDQAGERRLRETSRYLVLEYGRASARELGELYRNFAVFCIQRQIRRALVLAGEKDRAGEQALRNAITMMLLAGIPSDFRLALVAEPMRVAATYRIALRDLCAAGIATRLFNSEEDAARWLEGPRDGASSSTWLRAPLAGP